MLVILQYDHNLLRYQLVVWPLKRCQGKEIKQVPHPKKNPFSNKQLDHELTNCNRCPGCYTVSHIFTVMPI